jgi:hypothetical protein
MILVPSCCPDCHTLVTETGVSRWGVCHCRCAMGGQSQHAWPGVICLTKTCFYTSAEKAEPAETPYRTPMMAHLQLPDRGLATRLRKNTAPLGLCISSLHRGCAALLHVAPILTDGSQRKSGGRRISSSHTVLVVFTTCLSLRCEGAKYRRKGIARGSASFA